MKSWYLAFLFLLAALTANGGTVPVGSAKVDITPKHPVPLINVKEERLSDDVRHKLFARAMAIGEKNETVVLISFDGIGVPASLADIVCARLTKKHDIAREQIAICATHTHWAPHLTNLLINIYGGPLPPALQNRADAYTDFLARQLEVVASRALAARKPSRMAWTTGRVTFATNRRLEDGGRLIRDPDKGLMITWNPNAPTDHDLPVLTVRDESSGRLTAVHFTYACHNVAITAAAISGFDNALHGDWVGLAQDEIETRHPGCIAIGTIGCAGDQRPDFCGGESVAHAHAHDIADEIDRLLLTNDWKTFGSAKKILIDRVELPLSALPSLEELQEFAEAPSQSPPTIARAHVARMLLATIESGRQPPSGVPFVSQSWHFSDGPTLTFLCGEVCVDYQLAVKREHGESIWPIAYANATPCYIVSKRMLDNGGYEAGNSMFYYGWLRTLDPSVEGIVLGSVRRTLGITDLLQDDSLDAWQVIGASQQAWSVEDGTLICHGIGHPLHYLRTKGEFENFVLDIEWKLESSKGNSGVFVYADAVPLRDAPYPPAVEAQIYALDHGSLFGIRGASIDPIFEASTKGKTVVAKPMEQRCRPHGKWNHYRIRSHEGTLELSVNGKLVTKARAKDRRRGFIALQSEHHEVHFRNIRIRPLP